MSYQRVIRQLSGKRGRRWADDDNEIPRGRRAISRRMTSSWAEDGSELDVSEWSGVLYTSRIRNVARVR